MRTQVFEPLGMSDTRAENWIEQIPNRAAFYHPRFAAETRYGPESAREGDHSCWAGALAYLSTPSDLVRFGMAVNSGKLLQPVTIRTLQTPQVLASDEQTRFGLGWELETHPLAGASTRLAGSNDSRSVGGSTSLLTFPDRGIVVAVMTNTTFGETRGLGLRVAQVFAEQKKN